MSQSEWRHPDMPVCDSGFLDALGRAFGRRLKALKGRVTGGIEFERGSEDGQEQLRCAVETYGRVGSDRQVNLTVWADGELYIGVFEPRPHKSGGGWALGFSGYGDASDLDADVVVQSFEATVSESTMEGLRDLWLVFGLEEE